MSHQGAWKQRHRSPTPEVARAGVWVRLVAGARGLRSASWVPSLFCCGRGGWDMAGAFLERNRPLALAPARWGVWNWIRHFLNTCCTQAKVSKTREHMGVWRCGFSQSPLRVRKCDFAHGERVGSPDLGPTTAVCPLEVRSGLAPSTGLWTRGIRIPPSWSWACSAEDEQLTVLHSVC